jgi:hypothetical protein
MSQGGVFNLVLRDERFDSIFTCSDFLRERLDRIRADRKARGERNIQPTFVDIERTHMLYVRSDYRPYVAIASEYSKVKPTGDVTSFLGQAAGTLQFTLPTFGHWTSDIVLHIRIEAIGSLAAFAASAIPTAAVPLLRYCAYPGLRIVKKAEFKSAQVLIDDYTTDDSVAYSKFFVPDDARVGWDRCHGQQETRTATYAANGYTGVLNYSQGAQTPSLAQPALDLFIPLQFWMTLDASRALLNDLIPNSQRQIIIELASLSEIIQALLPTPSPSPSVPAGFAVTPLPFDRVPIVANLYVNSLYTDPTIYDVFASRIDFGLIRVHRRQVDKLQTPFGRLLMSQLKYPAEFFMTTARDRNFINDFDRWALGGSLFPRPITSALFVPTYIWNTTLGIAQLVVRLAVASSTLEPFIHSLGVTAHGVEIYPKLPASFLNAYLPIRYMEKSAIVAPTDSSAYLIPFCLYPGRQAVSGYYNLSVGREFYIIYDVIPTIVNDLAGFSSNQYEIQTSMMGLNFIVRRGDALVVRFNL